MSDCTNYKSPRDLGLRICTSDVTCYDGAALSCINLPSNPTLNDIITSTDTAICSLIDLVNNIVVPTPTLPSDPWVTIDELDAKVSFINESGSATWNDLTFKIAYRVLSESHAVVKVKAFANVNISKIDETIQFSFALANIPNADSTWFSTGSKKFQGLIGGQSMGVPITYIKTAGDVLGTHAFDYDIMGRAYITNGIVGVQTMSPKIATGVHTFMIEFEMVCELETV